MLYFSTPVAENTDLLQHFERFKRQYITGLNITHTHLILSDKHKELEPIAEGEIFKNILDYMAFYSVKCAIGERILRKHQISFSSVLDVHFFILDEVFVVEYND